MYLATHPPIFSTHYSWHDCEGRVFRFSLLGVLSKAATIALSSWIPECDYFKLWMLSTCLVLGLTPALLLIESPWRILLAMFFSWHSNHVSVIQELWLSIQRNRPWFGCISWSSSCWSAPWQLMSPQRSLERSPFDVLVFTAIFS